jgi:hypothetical protein
MGYTTGQTMVREGHAGLVLAQSDEFFDSEQRFPFTDVRGWFEEFFNVNIHHFGRTEYSDEHNLYIPATPSLRIDQIRRSASIARGIPVYRNLHKAPDEVSTKRPTVLSVYDRYYDDRRVVEYQGEAIYVGSGRDQHKGRQAIQSAMQEILADLGYGTPEEFAAAAVPLNEYQESHGIQWPPAPSPLEPYMIRGVIA